MIPHTPLRGESVCVCQLALCNAACRWTLETATPNFKEKSDLFSFKKKSIPTVKLRQKKQLQVALL